MTAPERIDYHEGGTALAGWLVRPRGEARAAVVIFPTIANITETTLGRARRLADAGYLAFVADFYGAGISGIDVCRPLADALKSDPLAFRRRLAASVEVLRSHPEAAGLSLGAIGYCMGGGAVLELTRAGEDLAVGVSFHGLLETALPAQPGIIKPRLLVCHGDADPLVPREAVLAFWQEMDVAGAHWHFHSYGGARHGFTDPASDARGQPPFAYDASADRQSWAAMMSLFDEVFV